VTATLADVVVLLDLRYPPGAAADWDAVGTVCGDPAQPVRKVLFAIDATSAVVDEALTWGADLLVTHHPLLLRGVHSVAATTFKGDIVHRLIRGGCALHAAHTNADAPAGGVPEALGLAVGLVDLVPLVPAVAQTPGENPGEAVGAGRVGRLPEAMTLRAFAEHVVEVLPVTAQGVRVAGDLDVLVETVAVVGGSGDSFFDAVRAIGADVYLTGDLRHHPALELRERAGFEAELAGLPRVDGRPFLVDVAHSASERPWLARAAARLAEDVAAAQGTTVETRVSSLSTDPWTARLASAHTPQQQGTQP
jgi:dinuclear metal center YbgI/SA1388 family protein